MPLLKTFHHFIIISFLLSVTCIPAQAGLVTSLLKLGKKADAPNSAVKNASDIKLQHLDNLKLPDGATADVVTPKLDVNGEWVLKNSQGEVIQHVDDLSHPVVVLDTLHIPDDLAKLEHLPSKAPLLLKSGKQVFQIQKRTNWVLKHGTIELTVKSKEALKQGIKHFERPWSYNNVYIPGLKADPFEQSGLARGISTNTLTTSPKMLREQTVILSGPIKEGKIITTDTTFDLAVLRKTATEYDINLVILEQTKKASPKQVKKQIDSLLTNNKNLSTVEFLDKFQNKTSKATLDLNPSGKSQVLTHRKIKETIDTEIRYFDVGVELTAQTATRIIINRPGNDRYTELKSRLIPGIPFWLSLYLIISTIAGFLSFSICRDLLRKFWPTKSKSECKNTVTYLAFKSTRLILIIGLIIPVFGIFCGLYSAALNIYYFTVGVKHLLCKGFNFLFIRPFKFLTKR